MMLRIFCDHLFYPVLITRKKENRGENKCSKRHKGGQSLRLLYVVDRLTATAKITNSNVLSLFNVDGRTQTQ